MRSVAKFVSSPSPFRAIWSPGYKMQHALSVFLPSHCNVGWFFFFLFCSKLPVGYTELTKILANCTLVASDSIIFSKALYKMSYITGHADLVTTGCISEFPIL